MPPKRKSKNTGVGAKRRTKRSKIDDAKVTQTPRQAADLFCVAFVKLVDDEPEMLTNMRSVLANGMPGLDKTALKRPLSQIAEKIKAFDNKPWNCYKFTTNEIFVLNLVADNLEVLKELGGPTVHKDRLKAYIVSVLPHNYDDASMTCPSDEFFEDRDRILKIFQELQVLRLYSALAGRRLLKFNGEMTKFS